MKTMAIEDVFTDILKNNATIIAPGEGVHLQAGEGSCTFKITSTMSNGTLGVYEIVVPPHTRGAGLHFHRFMDEAFIIKKGVLTLDLHTDSHQVSEGSVVYVPRFTPHGFANTSDEPVVITLLFNPSEQREGYFIGLFELLQAEAMDIPGYLQLAQKYDTHPLDMSRQIGADS